MKKIQIIGPFATEYSLARMNRSLAFALSDFKEEYKVELWADEFFADRLPIKSDYSKYPRLNELYKGGQQEADIAIFNSYPKSHTQLFGLDKINAKVKLGYLAWEETIYPKRWVDECNKNLHGIMTISEHVQKVLRNSGIAIPMVTVGNGVDSIISNTSARKYQLQTNKSYKFLHISSGHYRKGVDILLKAYLEEFSRDDDVVLVLKLFPNPDSEIEKTLESYKQGESAEIEIINDPDLTDSEIASLYKQCDAVVLPSRAEGFGMPMAEAMLMKKPLITTRYSGQMDFCSEEDTWLVDYELRQSKSSLMIPGAKLAEPDINQVRKYMRMLYERSNTEEVNKKIETAYQKAVTLTWENTAKKALYFVQKAENFYRLKDKNFIAISPFNSPGGIELYTEYIYSKIRSSFNNFQILANTDCSSLIEKDKSFVKRTWEFGEEDFGKTIKAVEDMGADFVHIQYNPPFFGLNELKDFVFKLKEKGIKVLFTFHSVQVQHMNYKRYLDGLAAIDIIYVHSEADKKFLNELGLQNIHIFKHGIDTHDDYSKQMLRDKIKIKNHPIIASHGLIHDKKGLLEIIEAINILKKDYPNILLLAINALNTENITSASTYKKMKETVKKHNLEKNVIFFTDYLSDLEVIKLIQIADLGVFPYPELMETSSAAVRKAMTASRPVIVSKSHIFKDLEAGYRIDNNKPQTIAAAIQNFIDNPDLLKSEKESVIAFVRENSWEKVVVEYLLELAI